MRKNKQMEQKIMPIYFASQTDQGLELTLIVAIVVAMMWAIVRLIKINIDK